jgi:putative transposase
MRIKSNEFENGRYYHIYNHAIANNLLFQDDEDYITCMNLITKYYNSDYNAILAFCLMPNHYHFLMQQKSDIPLFTFFNKVWYYYSLYYNKKHGTKGTIFSSKLQHIRIDHDVYLGYLCAYIHLNPVKAGLVESPSGWVWSNYLEFIEKRNIFPMDHTQRDMLFATSDIYQEIIKNLTLDKLDSKLLIDCS